MILKGKGGEKRKEMKGKTKEVMERLRGGRGSGREL
jgi:hypothetical protein